MMNMLGFGQEVEDLRSRQRCTDLPCCVVFLISLGCFCFIYIQVLATGNIARLYHGVNYKGQVCGVDEQVKDQPFLYWCMKSQLGGVPEVSFKYPICVGHCPGADQSAGLSLSSLTGMYGVEPECAVVDAGSMSPYKTTAIMDRFCLPDPAAYPELSEQISSSQLQNWETFGQESISSIASAWPVLLGSFFVSVMMGYVYLVMLRHCAEPLIYMTMLSVIVGFGVLGVYLLMNAGTLSQQLSESIGRDDVKFPPEITEHEELITKVIGVVCFAISGLTACMACCFHHSIEVGSACIEVACETIFEMPSLLLLPVLKAFFKGCLILVLVIGFLELYSTGGISEARDGQPPILEHSQGQAVEILVYMLIAFWILVFVNALYQFIVAYGVAEYYYTPYDHDREKDVGCCALWDGLYFGLITHGGSLAMGSFLIAVLMVFQKILQYAKAQNDAAGGNSVVNCLLYIAMCCVGCCKEFVEFVDKNAYIDIAISSNNFCQAAQEAMGLIIQLGGAMAILNGATFVFTLFGTLAISLGAAFFTHVVCSQGTFAEQNSEFEVINPLAPAAVAAVIGFLVALSFMHIFDMTSDTLLYCYGYDLKTGSHSTHAPDALKELVHTAKGG